MSDLEQIILLERGFEIRFLPFGPDRRRCERLERDGYLEGDLMIESMRQTKRGIETKRRRGYLTTQKGKERLHELKAGAK